MLTKTDWLVIGGREVRLARLILVTVSDVIFGTLDLA